MDLQKNVLSADGWPHIGSAAATLLDGYMPASQERFSGRVGDQEARSPVPE
jgi:hypothetical protein